MALSAWFWAILIGSMLFGFAPTEGSNARYWGFGRWFVWVMLFAILGYAVFNGPIKG